MTNKRYKKSLIILLSVLAMLWLVPMLIPMSAYVAEAEQQISQMIQRKVSIDSLGFRLLPSIRVVASGVVITGKDDEGKLTVAQLDVFPDIASLMTGDIRVKRVRLRTVQIPVKLVVAVVDEMSAADSANSANSNAQVVSDGGRSFPLQTLQIVDLHILLEQDKSAIGPYQVEVEFSADGLQQLLLSQRLQGELQTKLVKTNSGYDIEMQASQWRLPIGPAILFDSLQIRGNISASDLRLQQISGQLFGGSITANATAGWTDGYQFNGQLLVKEVATEQIVALFSQHRVLSALLSGEVNIALLAATPDKLVDSLKADGDLILKNSTVHALGKGLQIPHLQARLEVQSSQLALTAIKGNLYGGSIKGKTLRLNWADKMRVSGDISVSKLDSEKLLAVFLDTKLFSGSLNGKAKYTLTSSAADKALDRTRVHGRFSFSDGVIYNLDLAKAATSLSADAMKGGETAYETFTGKFAVINKAIDLTHLELESGVLKTIGEVHADQREQLSGNLEISIKDTMSIAAIDVKLQGSLSEPDYSLATGRNIGMAAGAMIGGPAGAAAGGTVGKTLEGAWEGIKGFFSGDDNEKKSAGQSTLWDDEEEDNSD